MRSLLARLLLPALAAVTASPIAGAASHATASWAAPPVIGLVSDSAGHPLPGVRIVVEGTNRMATTGADGTFTLRALAPGTYHLSASLIGYAPVHAEVTIPAAGEPVRVRLVLSQSPLRLEGLIVTGTTTTANPLTVTQSTEQMSGRELDSNVRASVAQTLAAEPGIATRYGGPATATPVIRGLSGERVLVLEDGQRTGDLSGTSPDHGLALDALSATRLEVVRGPASLLYGSSALGGVVNVIDNDIPGTVPSGFDGYVAVQGESVNPGGAGTAQFAVPLAEAFALQLRGGGRRIDDVRVGGGGVQPNTYFNNQYADLGLGYVGEQLNGGLAFGHYGFEYGLPYAPEAEEAGVHLEGTRQQLKGRASLSLAGGLVRDLRADASAQWYEHDEVEASGEVGTTLRLNTQAVELRAHTGIGGLRGTVGVSGLFRQYEPTGEEALTPAARSNSGGIFVYEEIPLRGVGHEEDEHAPRLQVGGRYDVYRIDPEPDEDERFAAARTRSFSAFSGSVGVNIPFTHETSLGLSVARAFRAPTVEELFSNAYHFGAGSFDRGNPTLRPETNLGGEGVLRVQTSRVQAQLSAYFNRISDYITPMFARDTTLFAEDGGEIVVPLSVFRQADAELRGLEGRIETVFRRHLVAGVMGDLVRGGFVDGGSLPFMPNARLGGSVHWDDSRLRGGLEVRHAFAQNRVPEGETVAGAYTLIDLSVGYTLRFRGRLHTLTLRGDNLLDERYREATSRIKEFALNPGRNVSVVYRTFF